MFQYLKELREIQLQYLEFHAGEDPLKDRYTAGLLAGINEVLNMRADEITNIEENPDD